MYYIFNMVSKLKILFEEKKFCYLYPLHLGGSAIYHYWQRHLDHMATMSSTTHSPELLHTFNTFWTCGFSLFSIVRSDKFRLLLGNVLDCQSCSFFSFRFFMCACLVSSQTTIQSINITLFPFSSALIRESWFFKVFLSSSSLASMFGLLLSLLTLLLSSLHLTCPYMFFLLWQNGFC